MSGDSSNNNVLGGFNAVLGYLGGQAATNTIFERLLWPQRYLSNPHPESLIKLAALYSMGGPLSATALAVIGSAYKNGILEGRHQGHMLGSAFYPDVGWTIQLHASNNEPGRSSKARCCIWVRALLNLQLPDISPMRLINGSRSCVTEEGLVGEKKNPVRARIAVTHLILTKATAEDISNRSMPFIQENTGNVPLYGFITSIISELSGVGIAIGVGIVKRTSWAVLFLIPFVLRILAVIFAAHREPLEDLSNIDEGEQHRNWEISCPPIEGRLMMITGPPSVVNQFFRHYGHPVRNRFREVIQIAIIVAFGLYFPISLLCSALWMPPTIQYVWTIWEVCLVIAMHIDRYTIRGPMSTTTEAQIARKFAWCHDAEIEPRCWKSTILFGQSHKNGAGIVKAQLTTRIVDSYGEGKEEKENLVRYIET
ncbi:hypothetical protein GGI43DRAFT_433628 [Trichoderma evansii]